LFIVIESYDDKRMAAIEVNFNYYWVTVPIAAHNDNERKCQRATQR